MEPGLRIAVSGSKGFLGAHLVRRLSALGMAVIELNRKDGLDVSDWSQIRTIPPFDIFIHLASRSFVPESFEQPRETLFTNVTGTLHALELCRLNQARMVFASTYVYGRPQTLPIDEEHPVAALNPYTESKVLGEQLCRAYLRDFGVGTTILRVFNIYGPRQGARFLIPRIIHGTRSGRVMLADGTPRRDFVHVEDVVTAYIRALERRSSGLEIYNVGSGVSCSVSEAAELIRQKVNPHSAICYTNEVRQGEIPVTVADISKAKKELEWEPTISFEKGIESCIQCDV